MIGALGNIVRIVFVGLPVAVVRDLWAWARRRSA